MDSKKRIRYENHEMVNGFCIPKREAQMLIGLPNNQLRRQLIADAFDIAYELVKPFQYPRAYDPNGAATAFLYQLLNAAKFCDIQREQKKAQSRTRKQNQRNRERVTGSDAVFNPDLSE